MATEQKGLAIAQQHIAFLEMGATGPHAFDFPTLQGQPGLEMFFNEIIVVGFLITCDLIVGS